MKLVRACALATFVALVLPGAALAHGRGSFTVVVAPASAAGGAATDFGVTLTNTSRFVWLGSADLTVPPGFAPGDVVKLRWLWLAPGATLHLTVRAVAPCTPGTYTWSAAANADDDFDGAPLRLDADASRLTTTVTSPCALRFAAQPASTVVGQPISASAFAPFGPPPTVQILDGTGAPASADVPVTLALANPSAGTLSGPTTVTAHNGVATFRGLTINRPASGDRLTATTPGSAPATSTPFDEVSSGVTCPPDQSCQTRASTAVSSLTVSAQTGAQTGTLSVSVDPGAPLGCAFYGPQDPNWYGFSSTNTPSGKLVTYRVRPGWDPDDAQFCFGAPYEFTTIWGTPAPRMTLPDGSSGFTGLLPSCARDSLGPCVLKRSIAFDPLSPVCFDIVLTVAIPGDLPGDPYGRV